MKCKEDGWNRYLYNKISWLRSVKSVCLHKKSTEDHKIRKQTWFNLLCCCARGIYLVLYPKEEVKITRHVHGNLFFTFSKKMSRVFYNFQFIRSMPLTIIKLENTVPKIHHHILVYKWLQYHFDKCVKVKKKKVITRDNWRHRLHVSFYTE